MASPKTPKESQGNNYEKKVAWLGGIVKSGGSPSSESEKKTPSAAPHRAKQPPTPWQQAETKHAPSDAPRAAIGGARMAKAYLEGHKTWQAAAEQGKKELRALQSALIKTEAKDVNNVIRGLDRVVTELPNVGERLQSLAKAAAKSDVDAISSGQNATRNVIKRCVDYLSGDALVASVDKNPFVKCSFKKTVATAIAQIQSSCPDIK